MTERASHIAAYFDRLWPICRSITGDGLRESFRILQELAPFELTEVPSGTSVFDWTVPKEWNIRDAYILDAQGKKWADFKVNNLHIVNYSTPVHQKMTWLELEKHLHTLPNQPTAIPYITSYFRENWGFCLAHNDIEQMPREGEYTVVIDSELKEGSLTYGQIVLPGQSEEEVFFSSYLCHPSMANNELSGPLALTFLYRAIAAIPNRKYTYRFLISPETVGVISFLSQHGELLKNRMKAGYVLTCCGDAGAYHYKFSKKKNSAADLAAVHALTYSNVAHHILPFSVGGSDERQYCSPGFNLPVGSLMRTPYQRFPEYHTSLDNRDFISFQALEETVDMYTTIVQVLENNRTYVGTVQHCEPQMGKRGLYPHSASPDIQREAVHSLMHLLSYADGEHDLLQIAELRDRPIWNFYDHVKNCLNAGLITEA